MSLTEAENKELDYLDNPQVELGTPPAGLIAYMATNSKKKRKDRVIELRTKKRMSEAGLNVDKNWQEYYKIRGEEEKRFDERFKEVDHKNNIDKKPRNEKADKSIKNAGNFAQIVGWIKIALPFVLPFLITGDDVLQMFISYSYTDLALNICVGVIFIILGSRIAKNTNENTKTYLWTIMILSGVFWFINFVATQKMSLIFILFIYSIYALAKFKNATILEEQPKYIITGWKWVLVFLGFLIILITGLTIDSSFTKTETNNIYNHTNTVNKITYNESEITNKDFYEFKIKDVGSIAIPNNMEVQTGVYKEINDLYLKQFVDQFDYEVSGDQIIFQQKGLNDLNINSFDTYSRIIIETEKGSIGDYDKLTTPLDATEQELEELSTMIKTEIEKPMLEAGIKMIEWKDASFVSVNDVDALKISYTRQIKDNPLVLVEMYTFFNNDRMHRLTLSYRLNEADIWKNKLEDTLRSFLITNVK